MNKEIEEQFTNEVIFEILMFYVREMFWENIYSLEDYEQMRKLLIKVFNPKGVEDYDEWSAEKWIEYLKSR